MKLLLAFLLTATLHASPCLSTGGVDIGPNQTGSGTYAYAATTGPVYATYLGTEACHENQLRLTASGQDIFHNKTSAIGETVLLGDYRQGELIDLSVRVTEYGGLTRTYFPGPGAVNPDGIVHFDFQAHGGGLRFGVEDLWRGGHEGTGDFDDLVGYLTNATDRPGSPVPEPRASDLVGFGVALCAIACVVRRRA